MKRIYLDEAKGDQFTISGNEHHYLKNVVRLKPYEKLGVLTADEFIEAEILDAGKRETSLKVLSRRPANKPDYVLRGYLCLLKREYMDFAVEKFAELGVTEIVPVISENSLNELKDKTAQRFAEIVKGAALQCENEFLCEIKDAVNIEDVEADLDTNILFYERGESKFAPDAVSGDVSFIIGPEGGFADEEVEMLIGKGFKSYTPVSSVLKAETASVVFTGMIKAYMEMK